MSKYNPYSSSENEWVVHLAYLIDELENDGAEASNVCLSHLQKSADEVLEYGKKLIEERKLKEEEDS
mgnify:FL=1